MLRKILVVAFLLTLIAGGLQAAMQLQMAMMTNSKPGLACPQQPTSYTTFYTTDTVAYLWFYVTGVNTGDVFATTYYNPSGAVYPGPSGAFNPLSGSGDACFTDSPFYIANSTPGSMPGNWSVKITYNGIPVYTVQFTIAQRSGGTASVSSLSPSSARAGSPAFTLTVNGSGFVSGSTVQWNGTPLSTSFISSTQLTASVPALPTNYAGSASVNVSSPGGGTSNSMTFSITVAATANYGITAPQTPEPSDMCGNPTPSVSSFQTTDSAAILWFHATGISSGDVIAVNFYTPGNTLYTDASYIDNPIPAGVTGVCDTHWLYIAGHNAAAMPGTWTVKATDNGVTLFTTSFTLIQSGPTVSISSLSPSSASAGSAAFTLTVNGAGFVSGAAVQWNGSSLSTTYVSASQLTAVVPATLIATAGTANVTVLNPGGIPSSPAAFSIGSVVRSGVLAQIAANGGWTTVVYLFNTAATPVSAILSLHADDGTPMTLPLTITRQGTTQTTTTSAPSFTISPNSTVQISMGGGTGVTADGWGEVLSSAPLSGFAIFRTASSNSPTSEGTVPLQTQFPTSIVLPYDNTAGSSTGVALANLSTNSATVTATVWDQNGVLLGTQLLTIPASGHLAFSSIDKLPMTGNKQGIVQFQSSAGALSAVGLRFCAAGTFTSVPSVLMP